MILSKKLELKEQNYFRAHIYILNALLPSMNLSNKEIEVLAAFMSFDGTLEKDRFSTTGKKMAKDILNMSTQSIWTYIKSLKEKNIIYVKPNGVWDIKPSLLPINRKTQSYSIKLINKGDEEQNNKLNVESIIETDRINEDISQEVRVNQYNINFENGEVNETIVNMDNPADNFIGGNPTVDDGRESIEGKSTDEYAYF